MKRAFLERVPKGLPGGRASIASRTSRRLPVTSRIFQERFFKGGATRASWEPRAMMRLFPPGSAPWHASSGTRVLGRTFSRLGSRRRSFCEEGVPRNYDSRGVDGSTERDRTDNAHNTTPTDKRTSWNTYRDLDKATYIWMILNRARLLLLTMLCLSQLAPAPPPKTHTHKDLNEATFHWILPTQGGWKFGGDAFVCPSVLRRRCHTGNAWNNDQIVVNPFHFDAFGFLNPIPTRRPLHPPHIQLTQTATQSHVSHFPPLIPR